jgi:Molecular chaperone GrpE (heat shock protein)
VTQFDKDQLETALLYFQARTEALEDEILKARADLDNMRKRKEEEKEEARRKGKHEIAESLLDVVDGFERALDALDDDAASGVEMLNQQLHDTLEKHGIERIEAEGEADSRLHRVVEERSHPEPSGHIVREERPGFKSGDRVIREAEVVVSKGSEDTTD